MRAARKNVVRLSRANATRPALVRHVATLLAASALLCTGPGAWANTQDAVVSGSTDLSQAGSYSGGATGTSSDVTFKNQTYTPSTFTFGSTPGYNLNIGTLDDFSPTALTIAPTTSGTITLNGGVNSDTGINPITVSSGTNFINNNPFPADLLFVGSSSNLTLANGAGGLTLNLAAAGNLDILGTATIGVAITGSNGLTMVGSGSLTLSGTSAYTGTTNVDGGTLILSGSLNPANGLGLGGGTLSFTRAGSQTFAGTTLSSGQSAVSVTSGTVALGAITVSATNTGIVNFTPGTGAITTTSTSNTGGIMGGYASFNVTAGASGTTWAVAPSISGSAITGLAAGSYETTTAGGNTTSSYSGSNVDVTSSPTLATGGTFNSLRFNQNAGDTVTLTGSNFITTGGILVTNNAGSTQSKIAIGGTLSGAAGSGGALYVQDYNTAGTFGLNTLIADNGALATYLVKSGSGNLNFTISANNTYSGGTYVTGGIVSYNATNNPFGTGPIYLGVGLGSSNVQLQQGNGGLTFTNALNIGGGPGSSISFFTNSGGTTFSGTTTLANNFEVDDNNSAGSTVAFTNTITGTGNFIVDNTNTAGATGVQLSGTGINFTGAIINLSTSTGGVSITGNLTGAESLLENSSGGSTMSVSGTNTNTGTTTVTQGTLEFTVEKSLYNNNTANGGWTASDIIVGPGATLAFEVGNAGGFTAADITTLNALGTGTGGFENGSILGIDTTGATFTDTNAIINSNGAANVVGLTKLGNNSLILTASNTYTGPTYIAAGTLQLGTGASGSNGSLASPSIYNSGTLLFEPAPGSTQTYAGSIGGGGGVTVNGSASGTVKLTGTGINTGATTVTTGTLDVAGQYALQNSTLTPSSGTDVVFDSGVASNAFNIGALAGNQNLVLQNNAGAGITLIIGSFDNAINTSYSGVLSGSGALTISGNNTTTLTGSNTYTGTTTVIEGTLNLGGAGANGSIGASGSAGPLVLGGPGGTATLAYTRTGTVSQTFNGTTINPGGNAITTSSNGQTLTLGSITDNPGGTVDFSGAGNILTSSSNTNGILGGYATYGGKANFAAVTGGTIGAYSNYTVYNTAGNPFAPGSTANVDLQASNGTAATTQTINSLRFNQSTTDTLTIAAGNLLTVASGGVLVTASATSGGNINGGLLTGSPGGQLAISFAGNNGLGINSQIVDNGGATAVVESAGSGARNLGIYNTNNSFSGGLFITGGGIGVPNGNGNNGTALGVGNVTFGPNIFTGANGGVAFGGAATLTSGLLVDNIGYAGSNGDMANSAGANTTWTLIGTGTATFNGVIGSYSGGRTISLALDAGYQIIGNTQYGSNFVTANGGTFQLGDGYFGSFQNSGNSGHSQAVQLIVGGGTFVEYGNYAGTTSQAFNNGLAINAGASTINDNSTTGAGTLLALNAFSRNAGGTVNFILPTALGGAQTFFSNGITTTTLNTNGILGGYATVGGTDWASNSTNLSGGNIVGLSASLSGSYTSDAWAPANNTTVTTNDAITSATTNSLRFNSAGANTVTLTGSNVISSGGILVTPNVGSANASAISSGTLTSGNGSDLIVIQNNTTAGVSSTSSALTIGSVIANNGGTAIALTKSGAGELILTATNLFTGQLYLNGGILNGGTPQIGTATGINFNGGTLQASGTGIYTNQAVTMGVNGGTFDTGGTNSLLSGAITNSANAGTTTGIGAGAGALGAFYQTGVGALTKAGAGILTLTATNTFTGGVVINNGTVQTSSTAALGTGYVTFGNNANTPTLDMNGRSTTVAGLIGSGSNGIVTSSSNNTVSTLTLNGYYSETFGGSIQNGATSGTVALTINFTDPLETETLSGSNSYTGATSVIQGILNLTGTINGSPITTSSIGAFTEGATGVLAGASSLTQNSAAVSILGGSNTFTGATTVTSGSLDLQNQYALQNSTLTLNTGGLVFDQAVTSGSYTLGGLAGSGTAALQNNASSPAAVTILVGNNNASTTFSGVLTGSGGLTKIGNGVLTLSNQNTYTGATAINAGVLSITGSLASTTGGVSVNSGGALTGVGNGSTTGVIGGAVTVAGGGGIDFTQDGLVGATTTLTVGGLTLTGGTNAATESYLSFNVGSVSPSTDLIQDNGTLTLTGSGNIVVNLFGSGITSGTYNLIAYTSESGTANNSFIVGTKPTGLLTVTLNNTPTNEQLIVSATPYPGAAYWSGAYQSTGAVSSGSLNAWGGYNNTGQVVTNWSDITGMVDTGQVPGSNTDVVFSAGQSGTGGSDGSGASLSGSAINSQLYAAFTINSLTFNSTPGPVSISGSALTLNALASGSGGLGYAAGTGIVDSSTSTVSISNALAVANSQSWTNNSAVSGTSLTISGAITSSATSGAVTIVLNGTSAGSTLLSGPISDGLAGSTLALTVSDSGGGITILSGSDTYTGPTTITSGTLQLLGSLGAGSTVNVGTAGALTGSGTANGSATLTGNGVINFSPGAVISGSLSVAGGNWNGQGSVTGATTSSSGDFNIGTGANLTANGGLNVTGGNISSTDNTGTITGSVNYTSATSSTFAGVIAGAGKTLTMNNSGSVLVLTGSNSYTGLTTITSGTLQIDNGGTTGALATSGTIVDNGVLAFDRSNTVTQGTDFSTAAITGSGAVTQLTSGTLVLNAANTFSGGVNVTNGTVLLSTNNTAAGSGTATLGNAGGSNSATLANNGITAANAITLAAADTTGTLTLANNGSNTAAIYNGGVALNGDNLTVLDTGSGSIKLGGAISGTGNLILTVNSGGSGVTGSLLLSNTVNNIGSITVTGTAVQPLSTFLTTSATPFIGAAITGQIGANVTGITLNTPSALLLSANNASFNGGITINSGALLINSTANDLGAATSVVNLAAVSGSTALLEFGGRFGNVAGANQTFANPIFVSGSGTNLITASDYALTLSGLVTLNNSNLTLATENNSGSNLIFNGGVSGTGNITISDDFGNGGEIVTFGTNAVNNVGTLTFNQASVDGGTAGSNATVNTITGGVGPNVTAITTSGSNQGLTISGSAVTVNSGSTTLTNANTTSGVFLVSSSVTGSGNLILNNNSAIANGVTISTGTVNNSGTVTNSGTGTGNTLISAVIGGNVTGVTESGSTSGLTLQGVDTFTGPITITSGSLTVSGAGQLGAGNYAGNIADSGTFIYNSSATQVLSGTISNGGAVTEAGPGVLTLTASNTYTGATLVSGGSLQVGNGVSGNIDTSSSYTVNNSGTLAFDEASGSTFAGNITDNTGGKVAGVEGAGITNTLSGAISGSGAFLQSGSGTTIFTGSNTYLGATTITLGTLQIGNGASGSISSSSAATVGAAGVLAFDEATSGSYGGTIADSGTVVGLEGAGITNTLGGAISGAGAFAQSGPGTTVLTASNSFSGGSNLTSGTLVLSNSNAVQNSTVGLNGGSVVFTSGIGGFTFGGLSGAGNLALRDTGSNPVSLTVGGNNASTTFTGNLIGGAAFTKNGTGTLLLGGTDTYAGVTTINTGILEFATEASLYNDVTSSWTPANLIVKPGATIAFEVGPSPQFTSSDITTLLNNLAASTGTTGLENGASIGFDTTLGTYTLSSNITNLNGGANILGLTKLGANTLTLTGTNTFSGPLLITNGTVQVGGSAALVSTPSLGTYDTAITTFGATNAPTLDLDGNNATIGLMSGGTNGLVINSAGSPTSTLTLTGNTSETFNGSIQGNTSLIVDSQTNGIIQTLGGANTYTGNTTIDEGTLKLDFSQTGAPASNILYNAVTSGTLIMGGLPTVSTSLDQFPGSFLNVTSKSNVGNTQTFGGFILNTGESKISTTQTGGGTVLLNLGAITRNAGGTVNFAPAGALSSSNAITTTTGNDSTGILGGWAIYSGTAYAAVASGSNIVAYTYLAGNTIGTSGTITDSATTGTASNILLNGAAGTITTSGSSNGATNVNTITQNTSGGQTLSITGTLRLGANGGILQANTQALTISNGTLTAGGTNSNTAGEITIVSGNNANAVTINSLIANNNTSTGAANSSGSGAVTLTLNGAAGAGTTDNAVVLNGNNTYSGGTYITGGRVNPTTSSAFGTGQVTILPGAQILTGNNPTFANTFNIAGSGQNEPGDPSTIRSFGTMTLTGTVNLIGDATLQENANTGGELFTLQGPVTGGYNLNLLGGNNGDKFLLSGSDSITGNLSLNGFVAGTPFDTTHTFTVQVGSNAALPSGNGNVIINGGGSTATTTTLDLHGFNPTINGLVSAGTTGTNAIVTNLAGSGTNSTLTLGLGNATASFNGNIVQTGSDGTVAITKTGTGTQVLAGFGDTFTGGLTINQGTLQDGNGNAGTLGSGNVTFGTSNNPTLDLNGNNPIVGLLAGAGTNGVITDSLAGSTSVLSLSNTGIQTYAGLIQNGAGTVSLAITGSGTQVLTGSNTYTGSTAINTGATLQLGNGSAGNDGTILGSSGIQDNGALIYNRFGSLSSGVVISGSGSVTKTGAGTQILTATNTYTGVTTIAAGVLNAGAADVTGTGGALGKGGNITFTGGTLQYSAASAGTDYSPRIQNSTSAITIDPNGQNITYASSLAASNTGGLTTVNTGSLTLTSSNSFTGPTTVGTVAGGANAASTTSNGGTLIAAATGALHNTSSITVNSGGTLIMSAANVATGSTAVNLGTTGATGAVATLAGTGGVSQGSNAVITGGASDSAPAVAGLGTLTLSANSTLDFGAGSSSETIDFANFSDAGSFTLNILDWNNANYDGSSNSGQNTDDRLIFGTDMSSFIGAGEITFNGSSVGVSELNLGNGSFEIGFNTSAVPEPSTILGGLALLGLVGYRERRRISAFVRSVKKAA